MGALKRNMSPNYAMVLLMKSLPNPLSMDMFCRRTSSVTLTAVHRTDVLILYFLATDCFRE